jgi:hypothetical protein
MKSYLKGMTSLIIAIFLFSSCSDTKTTSNETVQITTMDSSSKVLKEQADKLEAQTKKVEASLERMEKEFESENN